MIRPFEAAPHHNSSTRHQNSTIRRFPDGGCRNVLFWTYLSEAESIEDHFALIKANSGAITHLAPISHLIERDGTLQQFDEGYSPEFWATYLDPLCELAPCHPTISLPPGYVGTGVTLLLESAELQAKFVEEAVALAVSKDYTGFNMDIESSGGKTCTEFARFLTLLSDAMHRVGKTISVDTDRGFLDLECLSNSTVDVLADMNTYVASPRSFENAVVNGLRLAGQERFCAGLWVDHPSYDGAYVRERLEIVERLGVDKLCLWEDWITSINQEIWDELAGWLALPCPEEV